MPKLEFKVRGMCCAEEVSALRRELRPFVPSDDALTFDLLQAKLSVVAPSADLQPILEAVARTGMSAEPWAETPDAAPSAQVDARTVLTVASGLFMTAGYLWHSRVESSFFQPLVHGPGADHHHYPVATAALYAAAVVSGAWFVLPRAWASARRLRPDMNLLMVVALIGAFLLGEWFEAATVAFLFATALALESWSVGRARRAIHALVSLAPTRARFIPAGETEPREDGVESVPVGSRVLVRPGEKVPLDGVVVEGETSIDQSPITGEPIPAPKKIDDEVFAGTINVGGAFSFRSTREAGDTTMARVIRLVEEARAHRAPSERWVDAFALRYTPAMMAAALAVALIPPIFTAAPWIDSIYRGLVILVIACPCALVISTPVTIVAAMTSAARAGLLVTGGAHLETAARLRVVAFDKTGTLTHGRPEVREIIPLNDHTQGEVIERAAALETHSIHPLARSIVNQANDRGLSIEPADQFAVLTGMGAEGKIRGRRFWVGSHRYLHEIDAEENGFHQLAVEKEDAGHSLVIVGNDRHICGVFCVSDDVRDRAPAVVAELKRAGIDRVVMVTGDNSRAARAVAVASGVDEFHAEMLPEDKVELVRRLRERWGPVAMIGDGVNDAPAMAAADLGVAMGAIGSDAAIETADVALMNDDLDRLPWLIRHARRALATVKQNIAFALGLKLIFVVLALAGMATLWMAIAADLGASLLVIANGLRLLRPA
jgi:Cd2+/Zn2+-exporting ATPase